jgi:hypothetical protein
MAAKAQAAHPTVRVVELPGEEFLASRIMGPAA